MSTFWISLLVVIVILLLVQIRILKDKNERQKRHMLRMGEALSKRMNTVYADVVMCELSKPIGKRKLCKDCKLHKWFMIQPSNGVVVRDLRESGATV